MSVFITGACVLVIEIVATRVLSPFFGNTIFSTSSIISVVLLALSAGYYIGGKTADRHPSLQWFFSIISLSGLFLLSFFSMSNTVLEFISSYFSLITGPLLASCVLFLFPAFLLGMLSPYAVKLQSIFSPEKGTGSVSGTIFFWSTLGSIIGSVSSGFFLIPYFGVWQIMITNSVVLFVLGFIPLIILFKKRYIFEMAVFLLLFLALLLYTVAVHKKEQNVYTKDGRYEKITVLDGQFFGRPTRFFKQDHSLSGAMFLDTNNPKDLVYDYTNYYSIYPLFTPKLHDALVIGGGAYSIPKALLADSPEVIVDVSEIEPSLLSLSKKYFGVVESSRLRTNTEDGRRMLKDSGKQYDLIFSDVYYSFFSIPAHFTTVEFFSIAKSKLRKDGVFIANMIGDLSRRDPSLILSEMRTFQTAFPNSYFFVTESEKSSSQNIIFVGYNSDKYIDFSSKDVTNNKNSLIRTLHNKRIDTERFALNMYPLMTDNYSPVEYFTGKVLQRSFSKVNIFDGEEPLAIIRQLLHYGPRYPTAVGHARTQKFIVAEMKSLGQSVTTQVWEHKEADGTSYPLTNIIVRMNPNATKRILIGSHYDSLKTSFKNSSNQEVPSPGANNSASGVAILVNLVRLLNDKGLPKDIGVDIVFFDGEEGDENQGADFKDWKPLGSTYFANHLKEFYPKANPVTGIVLDMVCKKDLKIYKDPTSVQSVSTKIEEFWSIAQKVDANVFQDDTRTQVIRDDHTPLNQAGIPSFLLIDFEYGEYATTQDTLDKCSAKSLETITRALWEYLQRIK